MLNFKIPILMYHSIESMPKSTIMRSLHVSTKSFQIQMWLLNFFGYKGVSLNKLEPYLDGRKKGKVVGITFDDGYQNNLINAAPILVKYNFTATCYIVSDSIGTSNTWDIPKNITQRPLMSETEIRQWLKLGMDIGAHTMTHADLTAISMKEALREITHCKAYLESKFKIEINDFCYPFGRSNEVLSNLVKNSGYIRATTMIRGRVNSNTDLMQLPRVPINYRTLPHLFLAKILTKYEERR